jgi:hypothetical protein
LDFFLAFENLFFGFDHHARGHGAQADRATGHQNKRESGAERGRGVQ